jgi:hypothetical protein
MAGIGKGISLCIGYLLSAGEQRKCLTTTQPFRLNSKVRGELGIRNDKLRVS